MTVGTRGVVLEARGRQRRWSWCWALGLSAAAATPAGCGLIALFDLAALPEPRADGDGDADLDAEGPQDGDAMRDGGDAGDGDEPPWDPYVGCTGGATAEQWLVVAAEGEAIRSYRTGRDCAGPELICNGCVAAAFSPSGDRAVAFVPTSELARVHDELLVIDLGAPGFPIVDRGFEGALPAWVDDRTLVYLAEPEGWRGTCHDDPPPTTCEVVDLRRRVVGDGPDDVVAGGLERAWAFCCPVVSADGRRVVLSVDRAPNCERHAANLTVVDLETRGRRELPWTVEPSESAPEYPLGLLPDGSGLLVQRTERVAYDESKVYATTFDGGVVPVTGAIVADVVPRLVGDVAFGFWARCATARRLGPACEIYCSGPEDDRWYRRRLGEEGRELVSCDTIAGEVRIMDVRQVPVSERRQRGGRGRAALGPGRGPVAGRSAPGPPR